MQLRAATVDDAGAVHALTREAFAGQEILQPPSGATRETVEDVTSWIVDNGAVVLLDGDEIVAAARFSHQDGGFWLRRVAVRPGRQGRGLAGLLIDAGEREAARLGHREIRVGVRSPLVANIAYWRRRGFVDEAEHGFWVELRRALPVTIALPTAADTRGFGRRLAAVLRAGDLVVLSGGLGAGKTTLTQGIGDGLGVRGPVTSPTFVIARVHPALGDGPPLVHVDAFRLEGLAEVDDLDLDATLDEAVTVVEWGQGKVEDLSEDRLEVTVQRAEDQVAADNTSDIASDIASDVADEARTVSLRPVGRRWVEADLAALG
jgi:tRNA threonylcarbamoyladenosine biosynthesis protein TsaE